MEKSLDSEYENGVNTLNNSIINPLNMQITSLNDQNILQKADGKNYQENGTNRYLNSNINSMHFNDTFLNANLTK